jgi:hypothetical protein
MTTAKNGLITFCKRHRACAEGVKWANGNGITTLADAFDKCERGDWMIWMLWHAGKLTKEQNVRIAIACAEHVLYIFEKKYPDNKRPRKAIEATKAWLKSLSEEKAIASVRAKRASYAADSAAYIAYTATLVTSRARAATYAADSAAYAADAARSAIRSAYDATYAAVYADAAYAISTRAASYARSAERQWQADEIRKLIGNPWRKGATP